MLKRPTTRIRHKTQAFRTAVETLATMCRAHNEFEDSALFPLANRVLGAAEAVKIAKSGREQVERVGVIVHEAGDRARQRLEQIDQTVDSTVEQVGQVGDNIKRAVTRPVREVNGLAAGISAAVSTLVRGPRRSSVDHATQDEEMFI